MNTSKKWRKPLFRQPKRGCPAIAGQPRWFCSAVAGGAAAGERSPPAPAGRAASPPGQAGAEPQRRRAPGPGNRSLGTGRRGLTLGLYLHLFAVEQDVDGAIFIGAVIGNAHPLQLIQHLLMGMAIVIAFPYGDHRQGGVHSL